ncbi:ribosome silencing factor [Variovorax ginsengisoli]|uniref:Ribosomal silencing factor RsfS n=1 Tax=Variovorax ginsengisoli TaxID=363844 RepID=A0ABT9SBZ5_9BURK|nr:ribosome silencing factor [Variovorax ginsengisoli]MDP9901868.1 ribosome-associated protein [Variovorax ginsengisoli]
MTTEAAAKKDTQKLQRAIIDGLEDVKAQDIKVFDTEHLSPLFERVIVASGTSNRQTKALAASVRDAVREAGFGKPRIEGEVNGEWIIVDCGAAVAHIMQPAIRQYYHLEEIWGEKPVRTKLGAAKPAGAAVAEKEPAKKVAAAKTSLRRASAAKTAIREAEQAAKAEKAERARPARKSPARKSPAAKSAAPRSTAAKTATAKPASKPTVVKVGKPAAKKVAAKKVAAKKVAAKKAAPRKTAPRSQ